MYVATRDRVVLADEDDVWRKHTGAILTKAGFLVIGEASDGITALKIIRARQPELVVADVSLPGMSGLELARIVYEDRIAPVVLTAGTWQHDVLEKAKGVRAFGFLVKPFDETVLLPAVDIALAQYHEVQRLANQVRELKEALETRKVVERAKGILMDTLGLTESEAYRRIQRQSMNRRLSIRAVAEAIILAHGVSEKK
ncbi:MAG: Response regulator [Clostridia bacterium 62_21]|nr:MAG: Response regulator [Clostridia bacterium 62_21]